MAESTERHVCSGCAESAGFVPMPTAQWVDGECARCREIMSVARCSQFTHRDFVALHREPV